MNKTNYINLSLLVNNTTRVHINKFEDKRDKAKSCIKQTLNPNLLVNKTTLVRI